MSTVTSIGIGNMGAALASALLKASTPLTIWNRTADRPQVKSLITQGATFEPSLLAALNRSTTILICLLDYASIYSILTPLLSTTPTPLTGKTILNLTNGTPAEARAMASHLRALGASAYLDGAVMVTPQLVGTPAASILLSGETAAQFEAHAVAALLAPAGAVHHVADEVGAAARFDVAALASMYGMFTGAFMGIALLQKGPSGEGAKAKAKPVVDQVVVPMLKALVPYVSLLAEMVDREEWMEDLGNPLAMQLVGVENIMKACEEEGVDPSGLGFLVGVMRRAVEDGFGKGGVAAAGRYMSKE
ncbi:come operon protein 4 [Staphylotrichum tortipilum]|uniref:Come operon protein 4 n=1 Tax=Staphylotrichum tortipilum TaxID=2831512 RepID=A0AAN6MK38_9PEZI|nr:come operon protein 4 [Staphylotrichum longicolle]